MKINHIRLMSFAGVNRLDTCTPVGQKFAQIVGADVASAVSRLADSVASAGFSFQDCKPPAKEFPGCDPSPELAKAFASAMA